MNQVTLIGNLTGDPINRAKSDNKVAAHFTVATNEHYREENGTKHDVPAFHRCVAFDRAGQQAMDFLKKGEKVCVVGKIKYGSYQHQDGHTVYTTEIIVSKIEFLGTKKPDGHAPN